MSLEALPSADYAAPVVSDGSGADDKGANNMHHKDNSSSSNSSSSDSSGGGNNNIELTQSDGVEKAALPTPVTGTTAPAQSESQPQPRPQQQQQQPPTITRLKSFAPLHHTPSSLNDKAGTGVGVGAVVLLPSGQPAPPRYRMNRRGSDVTADRTLVLTAPIAVSPSRNTAGGAGGAGGGAVSLSNDQQQRTHLQASSSSSGDSSLEVSKDSAQPPFHVRLYPYSHQPQPQLPHTPSRRMTVNKPSAAAGPAAGVGGDAPAVATTAGTGASGLGMRSSLSSSTSSSSSSSSSSRRSLSARPLVSGSLVIPPFKGPNATLDPVVAEPDNDESYGLVAAALRPEVNLLDESILSFKQLQQSMEQTIGDLRSEFSKLVGEEDETLVSALDKDDEYEFAAEEKVKKEKEAEADAS